MTKKEIDILARELFDKVLSEYHSNPDTTMTTILDKYLREFSEEVGKQINSSIADIMNATVSGSFGMVLSARPISELSLSSLLYNNAKETARVAIGVLNKHTVNKSTINEIREALYGGYGYDELMDIKKKLPKYLSGLIDENKINKLTTKPLKSAYLGVLDARNDRELEKALRVALEERSRYIALRVAITEEHKAFSLANAERMLNNNIELVKVSLSSTHKIFCICDYHTSLDIGYGEGVYPIREAPIPPYHPFCRCKMTPVLRDKKWRQISSPQDSLLSQYNKKEKNKIAQALRSKWNTKTVGDMI